jgi:putative Mg2+ transporter-C (MgtC) family protein
MDILVEQAVKILWIIVIAGAIGLEREKSHKPAGLRTHILVGLGSTLITIISVNAIPEYPRLLAAVITGIGFIGAGTIIAQGTEGIHGLTTAANLWVVSALGICIGLGYYALSAVVAVLVIFILYLGKLEHLK